MSLELERNKRDRIALSLRIERHDPVEMAPCGFCQRNGRRCFVATSQSTRCSQCVRHGRMKCDYTEKLPSVKEWESLDRQRRRLRDKKDAAMREILRLNKEEELLDKKEKTMIERGLDTLDELDALEAKEKEEADRLVAEELAHQESVVRNLEEAETFLGSPTLDLAVFNDLPESFWHGLAPPSASVES